MTEYLMPCGHGSRFLSIDPMGEGLASHYCEECERIFKLAAQIVFLEARVKELEATRMGNPERED